MAWGGVREREARPPPHAIETLILESRGFGIIAPMGLLLARLREVAYAFEVADDTRHIVHIFRVAVGALFEVAFVDGAAVVADSVWDVEGEIVAALFGSHLEQLAVLGF